MTYPYAALNGNNKAGGTKHVTQHDLAEQALNDIRDFLGTGSTIQQSALPSHLTPAALSAEYVNESDYTSDQAALAGAGLVQNGSALDVNTDNVSLEIATDLIRVKDLGISTAKLANLGITSAKLADLAVTTAKLANLGVTTDKIADLNVTTAKIADLNVTTAKIAAASVSNSKLATMATQTIKGRSTAGTGSPEDLAPSTVKTILNILHTDISDFDTGVRQNRLDQLAAPTASVSMNNQKLVSLAAPTLSGEAARIDDVDNAFITAQNDIATKVSKSGDTMSGALAMGTSKIIDVGAPTAATDVARKQETDAALNAANAAQTDATQALSDAASAQATADAALPKAGGFMSGILDMNSNFIQNLPAPVAANDAARKIDIDNAVAGASDVIVIAESMTAINVVNSAAETEIITQTVDSLAAREVLRLTAFGRYRNASGATQILNMRLVFGNQQFLSTSNGSALSFVANTLGAWKLEAEICAESTNLQKIVGVFIQDNGFSNGAWNDGVFNKSTLATSSGSIDTTVPNILGFRITHGAAHISLEMSVNAWKLVKILAA